MGKKIFLIHFLLLRDLVNQKMSRICILHIGATKTGTTTIQHSLDFNRKILKVAGYQMLPNNLRKGNSDYLLALSHNKNKLNQETQDIYSKFFTKKNKSNIILTSELFSVIGANDRDFFKKIFNFLFSFDFKVYVILFVRNQKEWILSDYIQDVKGGGIYNLEKYVQISLEKEPEKYDLYKLISYLKNSGVNLTIKPYLRDIRKKWKAEKCFYNSIPYFDLPLQKLVKKIKDQNTLRPSRRAIDEIINFNKVYRSNFNKDIDLSNSLKKSFIEVVNALAEIHASQETLELSKHLENQIEKVYSNGNKKLCNEFKALKKVLIFD